MLLIVSPQKKQESKVGKRFLFFIGDETGGGGLNTPALSGMKRTGTLTSRDVMYEVVSHRDETFGNVSY